MNVNVDFSQITTVTDRLEANRGMYNIYRVPKVKGISIEVLNCLVHVCSSTVIAISIKLVLS